MLSLRTIESYLLDDEVLTSVCAALGQPDVAAQALQAKQTAIQTSTRTGYPADNWKIPAGDVYLAMKRLFPGQKLGSDKRAFMKGLCAAQIKPGLGIYARLRDEIFA